MASATIDATLMEVQHLHESTMYIVGFYAVDGKEHRNVKLASLEHEFSFGNNIEI